MKTLFSLAEQIRRCTKCSLYKDRLLTVPGEGSKNAKVMFVGEAPGEEENRQGLPFLGRSGKVLDELLKIAGLKRNKVFITGSLKCHPPKNRNPKISELKSCKSYLEEQIKLIKPELIVILSKVALKNLLNETNLTKLHGKTISKDKQKYFITYHPTSKINKEMVKDFKKLNDYLNT
jgi:uracil-DNA glycosylase